MKFGGQTTEQRFYSLGRHVVWEELFKTSNFVQNIALIHKLCMGYCFSGTYADYDQVELLLVLVSVTHRYRYSVFGTYLGSD